MASRLIPPRARFEDFLGNPLAGGKLYTYVAGTVATPKTAWVDQAGTIPASNPIILGPDGETSSVFLSGAYKIVLKDEDDVQQWAEDNVRGVGDIVFTRASDLGSDISASIAFAGSTLTTILIDTEITCLDDEVIPATLHILMVAGGSLNVSSGKTLAINGPFDAPQARVFTGSGTITGLARASRIIPHWWGCEQDGVSDDAVAMNKANALGVTYLPPGTYYLGTPLTFTHPYYGAQQMQTVIRCMASFSGAGMLDFNAGTFHKFLRDIYFDANNRPGVQVFFSTASGADQGSSIGTAWNLRFINVADNVNAIGNDVVGNFAGMLTGWTFFGCEWNCYQWVYLGNLQDDVRFINCRFSHPGPQSSPPLVCFGGGVAFDTCYFAFGNTNNTYGSGIKPLILVNINPVSFNNCFFESNALDSVHPVFCVGDEYYLSFKNCSCRLGGTTALASFVRASPGVAAGLNSSISVDGFQETEGITVPFLSLYATASTTRPCHFSFKGMDRWNAPLFTWAAGTVFVARALALDGFHGGVAKRGFVDALGTDINASLDSVRYDRTIQSGTTASPAAVTYPITGGAGHYLMSVTVKLADSRNDAIVGTWIVHYNDGSAGTDILSTQSIDTPTQAAGAAHGTLGITAGNPNAAGEITLTATWTAGADVDAYFHIKLTRLSGFDYGVL